MRSPPGTADAQPIGGGRQFRCGPNGYAPIHEQAMTQSSFSGIPACYPGISRPDQASRHWQHHGPGLSQRPNVSVGQSACQSFLVLFLYQGYEHSNLMIAMWYSLDPFGTLDRSCNHGCQPATQWKA
jgi:hypothetical protein